MFGFVVACSPYGNNNTNKSEYVQKTKLYDFYNEYQLDLDNIFDEFYFGEGVFWDIAGDFANEGGFYQVYQDDSIIFWLDNTFDDTINILKKYDNISIEIISLGNIDKNFPERDITNIGISVDTEDGKYYYVMYYDYMGIFHNIKDKTLSFIDTLLMDNYTLATTVAYVMPNDEQEIDFLFPIQYAIEYSKISNNTSPNQMVYKLKMTFDQFANFYKNTAKDDYAIDYETQTVVFDSIKYNTDEYSGVSMQYTSDGEYGSVLCTPLK